MAGNPQDTASDGEVLGTLWSAEDQDRAALEDEFGPQKVCRNMRAFSFEDLVEDGEDVGQAFRSTLAKEGKLGGSSLRELIEGKRAGTGD